MEMLFPSSLQTAIEQQWTGSAAQLEQVITALSLRYRSGQQTRYIRNWQDVVAYSTYRMPATFAVAGRILTEVRQLLPAWQPASLLDAGAGPGTIGWAATSVWPQVAAQMTLLEQEPLMIRLGRQLAQTEPIRWRHADWRMCNVFQSGWDAAAHDLVVASYMLGELPQQHILPCLDTLWARTAQCLVVIEPGTPAGFDRIRRARDHLLAAGANLITPCPHAGSCPVQQPDWCHFAQRLPRTRLHRIGKQGARGFEDETYTYVAFVRDSSWLLSADAIRPARIVRRPDVHKGHLHLHMCTPDGQLATQTVTRKQKARYRVARQLEWGDIFPVDEDTAAIHTESFLLPKPDDSIE